MRSVLIDCRKIEEFASKIYQNFAADTVFAVEVRKVFQQLSDDERAHARHIDLVLQANGKDVEAAPLLAGEKVSHAVAVAEAMFQKVEREKLDEESALRLAVDMEQQFVKVHVQNALHFHNRKLAELFNKLGSEDEAHLNTLKKCLQWWHAERKKVSQGR